MDYDITQREYLVSFMFPMIIFIVRVIGFQALYLLRVYEKRLTICSLIISIIGVGVFWKYTQDIDLVLSWLFIFGPGYLLMLFLNRRRESWDDNIYVLDEGSLIVTGIEIALGVLFLIVSFTPLPAIFAGTGNMLSIIISRTAFVLLSLSFLLLNKRVFLYFRNRNRHI